MIYHNLLFLQRNNWFLFGLPDIICTTKKRALSSRTVLFEAFIIFQEKYIFFYILYCRISKKFFKDLYFYSSRNTCTVSCTLLYCYQTVHPLLSVCLFPERTVSASRTPNRYSMSLIFSVPDI